MYVGTADVHFDDADLFFPVHPLGAGPVFLQGETADVGDQRFVENLPQMGQFLPAHRVQPRILQPHGIQHAVRAFRNAGQRISVTGFQRRSLERNGTQNVQVIQLCEFPAEPEGAAGRNHRIVQRNAGKRHTQSVLCIFHPALLYHMISSRIRTGPSLQIRFVPYFVLQLHPIQAPKPQPMRSSKLNCPSSASGQTARSIGSGPQAKT